MERNAFEYLYSLKKEQANPNGVNADFEQGVLKGIVEMAFFAGIITDEEMATYYGEIYSIYSIVNKLEMFTEQK